MSKTKNPNGSMLGMMEVMRESSMQQPFHLHGEWYGWLS